MTTSALDAFVIWALAIHGREITALTDRHKHRLAEPGRYLAARRTGHSRV
jgi:hypothetical protein